MKALVAGWLGFKVCQLLACVCEADYGLVNVDRLPQWVV